MISVDGLRPDLVLNGQEHGIDLANIRGLFVGPGAYAPRGMTSVTPSLTYPNHQALITGTFPATNGTATNRVFDPTGVHQGAWVWWVSKAVPTLWTLAAANGYFSVNVSYPTSGGAFMHVNIPDFWRDGTSLDDEIINMVSTPPGLVREMLGATGVTAYPGDAFDLASDRKRHQAALWVLENKVAPRVEERPFFMTAYYASYDNDAHEHGTFSKEALKNAMAIDKMVGELVTKATTVARGNLVVVLVSDHGFMDIRRQVRPNTRLREAGLIKSDEGGNVTAWKAWFQRAGGMGQVRLFDPKDSGVRAKVENVLTQLKNDPNSGVSAVWTRAQTAKLRAFPEADYVLVMQPGVEPRDDHLGSYEAPSLSQKAAHGFLSDMPDMKASFFIAGPGVRSGPLHNDVRVVDVAPTLAALMRFKMPNAEGKNIFR
jgi:predicted AlkP superfamily pyrophosphatase or phosphodiesterase